MNSMITICDKHSYRTSRINFEIPKNPHESTTTRTKQKKIGKTQIEYPIKNNRDMNKIKEQAEFFPNINLMKYTRQENSQLRNQQHSHYHPLAKKQTVKVFIGEGLQKLRK